jgi:hypothetical protein
MSQLSQQGVFKMTKVLSVNDRTKVWEKRRLLRDLSFHINAKSKVIIIASPARAYLDKKCNRSWGRLSIG